jgi:pyruvate/2-oxoglutarate dehydrogenase complex dihydrolipoamide acyltransferase (E2) component
MAVSVFLPHVGMGVSEATILVWLKGVGDVVAVGEPIAQFETAKSTLDLEAPVAGVLSAIHVGVDQVVELGVEIALIEAY